MASRLPRRAVDPTGVAIYMGCCAAELDAFYGRASGMGTKIQYGPGGGSTVSCAAAWVCNGALAPSLDGCGKSHV